MKKLVFAMCIAFVVLMAACKQPDEKKTGNQNSEQQKDSAASLTNMASPKLNLFTLNGIPLEEANAMISRFINNKGSYDNTKPTSVWFSAAAFQKMYSLISTHADGIRFYFAKTIPDGKYTIVAVSTLDGGLDPDDLTKNRHIHMDYFQNSNPSTANLDVTGVVSYEKETVGATLYAYPSPCKLKEGEDGCPTGAAYPHYLSCDNAYKMVNYYGNDPINSTSEWFDLGVINDLNNSLIRQKGNGIRVYFARHLTPDGSATPDTVHRHGVVLITTEAVGDLNQDYYDCLTIHPHYKGEVSFKKHNAQNQFFGGTDNGEQCPTNCGGTTWP